MKPVSQTIFYNDPEGRKGNCLQAVIASLVEKPIEEVPHFAAMDDNIWFDATCYFLNNNGLDIWDCDKEEMPHVKDNYVMATGKSLRGVNHVVLYQNGKLAHDPHPSGSGISDIQWCAVIVPRR